ncbi:MULTISPECIES: HAD-IA family hydrolase [unclassified Streptomyces]|uniref:HAD-IA family hydrolase n=1 Tax=unclassified Streptomyces TaxID=2593676 RepID=UPI00093FD3D7|nr:HAD-IA family hydrolase [Streptomyces sp. TSRI0281]
MTLSAVAVLFDMDGVLVDSSGCISRAWFEWAGRHGLDAQGTLALGHGLTTLDHIRAAAPALATEKEAALIDELEDRHVAAVIAQPGAAAATSSLTRADVPWGVVTSCSREAATARLATAGLPLPSVLITADDVTRGKPAPDGYLTGISRVRAEPHRTVVFEDAPSGITAAQAAGAHVIALSTTHAASQLLAVDSIVPDLSFVRFQREPHTTEVAIEILAARAAQTR